MAEAKLHKVVSALPGTLEADSVYFVRVGAGIDIFATNSAGSVSFKHNAVANAGNAGIAQVDFGASGSDLATAFVVGQAGITANSVVTVSIALRYTPDHYPDDALIEQMDIRASVPSSDTGFTIYAITRNTKLYGKYDVYWSWR